MHGFALLLVGLAVSAEPIELDRDVEDIQVLDFRMPLRFDPAHLATLEKVRLFVSEDGGKTWEHHQDYETTATEVTFRAPRDGLYWFALQAVSKDGTKEPPDTKGLTPAMKVLVNTERRALKPRKSYAELEREVDELRKTVEELRRRNAELEPGKRK